MLARISSVASRSAPAVRSLGAAAPARLASGAFDKKEIAEEKRYFNAEEERLLRQLASKARQASAGTAEGKKKVDLERAALDFIVNKYKVSEADKDALIQWRHSHDY